MVNLKKRKQAQSTIEYISLVGMIIVVLFAMNPMMKRIVQSVIKLSADQIGNQAESDQSFDADTGYLDSALSGVISNTSKQIVARPDYQQRTIYKDKMTLNSSSVTTLGFQED